MELLAFVVPLLEVLKSGYPTNGWIEWSERWEEDLTSKMNCGLTIPKPSSHKEGQYI